MRRSWLWVSLLAWIGLVPYHAAAADCQNPQRADELAICRDRELGTTDARRVALYESMLAARPEAERQAFSSYERRWTAGCRHRADGIDWRCHRQEIEDHIAELQSLDGLRFVSRERPDNDRGDRPNLDIHATWVEFVDHEFRRHYPLQEAIQKFSADLKQQERWSFSRRSVDLQFNALINYSGGNFVCRLGNEQLARLAIGGAFPP